MQNNSGVSSLHNEMIAYIREKPDGAESRELAERFLKFKSPMEEIAHKAVAGILGQDARCSVGDSHRWYFTGALSSNTDEAALTEVPWTAAYLLSATGSAGAPMLYAAFWEVFDTPRILDSFWIGDFDEMPSAERDLLVSARDRLFSRGQSAEASAAMHDLLARRTVVFLSGNQQGVLSRFLLNHGDSLLDDVICFSSLAKAGGVSLRKPLSLTSCYKDIIGKSPVLTTGYRQSECFAECVLEMLRRLIDQGMSTRADLDSRDVSLIQTIDWSSKAFTYDDILGLPQLPGVYGFQAKDGSFLYIGKAGNLRRRLTSYFRSGDESPAKLERLRDKAHAMTVHVCGSELESLLYEYRLIRKHKPCLNTQTHINERKGEYAPIQDCIVLLPHADSGMGMSIWFRRDQKIVLRAFSPEGEAPAEISRELEAFFFSRKLPVDQSDYPEQEIVVRYVKRHREGLITVPVDTMADGMEVWEGILAYWPEVRASQQPSE